MKIRDELVGRDVLDGNGHKIGEVDDIEVDFESQKIDSIIIGEGKLIGRGNERRIPFDMVETVGERVILTKESVGRTESREEGRMGREERGGRESYVEERELGGREERGRSRDKPFVRDEERY